MNIEEFWSGYTSSEQELFQKSCRRLLKQTFIVRDKDEDNKRLYYFISRNVEPFSTYLGYIGFDVVTDRENGVVMLCNCRDLSESGKIQVNHVTLKKVESIVLCCLWTIYADRIRKGSLSRNIVISMTDLKFELEKCKLKDQIDKSTMTGILAFFSRYQLLQMMGKIGDEDCRIALLPSMQFALNMDEFTNFVNIAEKRMKQKWNDSDEDEEEPDGEIVD